MAAAQAWAQSGPKSPFDRYRLILARYSSKYPGHAEPGRLVHAEEHQRPRLGGIRRAAQRRDHGLRPVGLDAFDASTGHPIA